MAAEITSHLTALSVLAVDDEKDILDTIEDVLDKAKVDRATDYDSASQKLKDRKYDLAILDIMGVNGLDLLVEAVNKGIPTVMLTAHAMNPETLKASITKGALSYIPKEELTRLDELVNELLEAHKKGNSTWPLLFERLGDYFEKSFVPGWAKDDPEFWKYYGYIPADVLARVQLIRDELDELRFEMGKLKNQKFGLMVSKASPHEVFFQALTLNKKVNRLVSEMTGRLNSEENIAVPRNIRPFHVWRVVDATLQQIVMLKRKLGLRVRGSEKLVYKSATPTEVFLAIGLANQEVNLLLERPFVPRDVFIQVTLATHYAARLLAQFPSSQKFPKAPKRERGQRPADVYNRLIDCENRLSGIADRSHVSILKLETRNALPQDIQPSDEFDMASLLVSELAHFNGKLRSPYKPKQMKDPGLKFPSHVHQQAGVLLSQLEELEQLVRTDPDWLKR